MIFEATFFMNGGVDYHTLESKSLDEIEHLYQMVCKKSNEIEQRNKNG